jgi:hypothetical protein
MRGTALRPWTRVSHNTAAFEASGGRWEQIAGKATLADRGVAGSERGDAAWT